MNHPTPPPDSPPPGTPPPGDPSPGPAASAKPRRVGVLLGDRLCIKCGFNLHGQTIAREEHYDMLAVRCPECFTIASLQEYPTLGPWAVRFGLVLALAWGFCIFITAFLTGLTYYASAEGVAGLATRPAARQIAIAFEEYRQANLEPEESGTLYAADSYWVSNADESDHQAWVDPAWLTKQNLDALTGNTFLDRFQLRAFAAVLPFALGTAAWGVVWSVLLLHRRLRLQLLVLGGIVSLSTALVVLSHWGSPTAWDGIGPWSTFNWGWWGVQAQSIAARGYGLLPALLTIAIGFVAMIPGLLWGRMLVRGLVRLFLPPHLRGPLAMLWHVDGLPSPPTRGEFWTRG